MQTIGTATKVTVYIGESDKWGHRPLYSAILEMLKREDCAGATVTRGLAGFGAASRIHSASIIALSEDLPLVIQWIDDPDRVERVMPKLVEMVVEGLITVEQVDVVAYTHRRLRELRTDAPVSDIMHREVKSVDAHTPLSEAVELLIEKVYRALPVVDTENHVIGILTDSDLLNRANLITLDVQRALTQTELSEHVRSLAASGQTVSDVMTGEPVTVHSDATIGQAVRIMSEKAIKRLPVVDGENRLIGMVGRIDLLRALAQPPMAEAPERRPRPGRHTKVGEIMLTDVPFVQSNTTLDIVVDLLARTKNRRVVVVDDQRRVLGIITDADLLTRAGVGERADVLEALSQRSVTGQGIAARLGRKKAAEVMTRNPITVRPETPLLDALQLLLIHKIKRLPVLDGEGHLVGLVGRGGILQCLAKEV